MGGENLAEIQFNNCEMPLEHLIIREDGFRKLLSAFNTQRCMNPSVSLGLAEDAFGEPLRAARDREAVARPIDTRRGWLWMLAGQHSATEGRSWTLHRAAQNE